MIAETRNHNSCYEFREIGNRRCLFIGEGNLSFALEIVSRNPSKAAQVTATTFEHYLELDYATRANRESLIRAGSNVIHSVDATQITATLGLQMFDRIVFQFPNVGSRKPVYGQTANSVLVKRFLQSAKIHLNRNGQVVITIVDSTYYMGNMAMLAAARFANMKVNSSHTFNPALYHRYQHRMTRRNQSALSKHKKFKSWVFVS